MTNPARFAPLVAHADAVVARLVATYDVVVARGDDTVLLTPAAGAPLSVEATAFPGLVVRFGSWAVERFPACGCDACDEQVIDQVELLEELVADVVEGRVVEELSRRHLRVDRPTRGSRGLLSAEEAHELAARSPRGRHVWPAWPARGT